LPQKPGAALGESGQPAGDAGEAAGRLPEDAAGALGQARQRASDSGDDARGQPGKKASRRLRRERQCGGEDREPHGVAETVINDAVGFVQLIFTHVVDVA
jgi:hypothetical protein